MPIKAPRLCPCGHRIPSGERCACEVKAARERKARHDAKRPSSSQRGYTGAWDKAKALFLRANPFCKFCGAAADTVDHKTPHRGDAELFWDKGNWQALCGPCHNSAKQRLERKQTRF